MTQQIGGTDGMARDIHRGSAQSAHRSVAPAGRPGVARSMRRAALVLAGAWALAGCSADDPADGDFPPLVSTDQRPTAEGSVFGTDGGISLLGNNDRDETPVDGGGIGVNSFLWRASLDTIAFMPLDGTPDPFGGVIITDWWSPADAPEERFKANIFILGRELRSDGIRVALFRQLREAEGGWVDSQVDPAAVRALEDAILARARELRVAGG